MSNGYEAPIIDKIIKKYKKPKIQDITNLKPIVEEKKFVTLPYNPDLCKGLDSIFKSSGLRTAYRSDNTLRKLLGTAKDKLKSTEKSGIYLWSCEDCECGYIGQTKRNIGIRCKEHLAHFKNGRVNKSSIGDHLIDTKHKYQSQNLILLKETDNKKLLNIWESFYIYKYNHSIGVKNNIRLLYDNDGPIGVSQLFKIIK